MSTLIVGKHAAEQATARFGIPAETSSQWVRGMYAGSRYVAEVPGDNGVRGRLYVNNGVALILAPDVDKVITVYQPEPNDAVKADMAALIKRKISAADRKERTVERRVRVEKAKLSVELAQCNLRMELTPSKAVIKRNTEIVAEIQASMAKLDAELTEARRTKNGIVKSLAAYL
jgi:hypothetical protein